MVDDNLSIKIKTAIHCLVFVPLLAMSPILAQQPTTYVITGRVIDDKSSRGLAGADIYFEPEKYAGGFDRFITGAISDDNGRFRIERKVNKASLAKWQLFVALDATVGTYVPILPPFDLLRLHNSAFNGISLPIGNNTLVDVGDVPVRFRFGSISVLIKRVQVDRNLFLRVSQQGNCVHEGSLSKDDIRRYFDQKSRKLRMALPEGCWRLELIKNGRTVGHTKDFHVVEGKPLDVNVIPGIGKTKQCSDDT